MAKTKFDTFFNNVLGDGHIDIIEFAAELGQRFGDLSNYAICLACSEYLNNGRDVNEDSTLGDVVITAYDHGEEAGRDKARFYRFNKATASRVGIVL